MFLRVPQKPKRNPGGKVQHRMCFLSISEIKIPAGSQGNVGRLNG